MPRIMLSLLMGDRLFRPECNVTYVREPVKRRRPPVSSRSTNSTPELAPSSERPRSLVLSHLEKYFVPASRHGQEDRPTGQDPAQLSPRLVHGMDWAAVDRSNDVAHGEFRVVSRAIWGDPHNQYAANGCRQRQVVRTGRRDLAKRQAVILVGIVRGRFSTKSAGCSSMTAVRVCSFPLRRSSLSLVSRALWMPCAREDHGCPRQACHRFRG